MNSSKYRSNADSSMMQEEASAIKPSNNSEPIINVLSEVLYEVDCLHPKRFRQESVARRRRCSNMTVNDFMCSSKKII